MRLRNRRQKRLKTVRPSADSSVMPMTDEQKAFNTLYGYRYPFRDVRVIYK